MHLNYYILKRLTEELTKELIDATLLSAFSQEKDELILGFLRQDDSDFYIRATLQSDFAALSFPQSFARSKKNNIDLFPSLIGKRVEKVHQFENERAFYLKFSNGASLLFKMHGNRSNIILIRPQSANDLFKKSLINDNQINIEDLERPISRSLDAYLQTPDYRLFYPTFGKVVKEYLLQSKFSEKSISDQWEFLINTEFKLINNPFFLTTLNNRPSLSLLPLNDYKELSITAINALNIFYQAYHRDYLFEREKAQTMASLNKRINQANAYIEKNQRELSQLENAIPPNQLADIIMANLHLIKPKQQFVTLFNFYSNTEIEIKLNKDLSPQKNAENYYRKSKNRKIEVEKLTENILNKEDQLTELNDLLTLVTQTNSIKSLRQLVKQSPFFNLKSKSEIILPYKSFTFQGYQIWVGKNAKSNDELTLKHAFKEDLWLHAKDVAGSHVLIKHQSGKVTPIQVIERAAGYAAYYSKRKTDTLVPVLFTPVKYVRKKKGAAPGQVFVSQEKVLMIPALGPQD